jgi:endonuclease YncB( thermonuclease family)
MLRTTRLASAGLVTALLAGLLLLATGGTAHAADRDCSDFDTQAQAQSFFLNNDPDNDPHRLDADGDRIACETLPCPCSTTTSTGGGGGTTTTTLRQRGRVVRVVDGDTADVRLASNGVVKRVRLLGIDTPERDRCGYTRATRTLRELTPVGTRVTLVSDPSQALRDRYGRLLRYVVRNRDGRDMNKAQVNRGLAKVYVYNHDPFRRVSGYRAAQYDARTHNRGLWATCW